MLLSIWKTCRNPLFFLNSNMFNCLHVNVWLAVKYNCQLLVKGRRNIFSTLCVCVSLLSQSKAFQLYSGSFGDVNKLWKLNFNLWLIFTHHTWERNANEHEHSCNKGRKISIFKQQSRQKYLLNTEPPPQTKLFTMSWNVLQHEAGGNASSAVTEQTHTYTQNKNTILFQWTCNTLGNVEENTLRIHGRLELSHLDEFHPVAMITTMNQKNRHIKSPWVPLLCLQSIPFSVSEAALVDYNIAAVHAKIPDKGAGRNVNTLVMWQSYS